MDINNTFPGRIAEHSKKKGFTQQVLADYVGAHVVQIRRYEAGKTQPTLEVLRKLAIALSVSADVLLFDKDERGPHHSDLRLKFEAVEALDEDDQHVITSLIDAYLNKRRLEELAASR